MGDLDQTHIHGLFFKLFEKKNSLEKKNFFFLISHQHKELNDTKGPISGFSWPLWVFNL